MDQVSVRSWNFRYTICVKDNTQYYSLDEDVVHLRLEIGVERHVVKTNMIHSETDKTIEMNVHDL